jgi:hypothetical protein
MSQLTWAQINGFFDLADAVLDPDQPVTDDLLKKINHNAKAAAVRCEIIYMGFYKHGNTVGTPTSPVDGYAYSRAEMSCSFEIYTTRAPASITPGQATPPAQASSNGGAGTIYWTKFDINDSTGAVSCQVSYYVQGGAETVTNDGCIKVYALCMRQSVNVSN